MLTALFLLGLYRVVEAFTQMCKVSGCGFCFMLAVDMSFWEPDNPCF
jgi:hypothetical protein